MIRVLIADDHAIVRAGLRTLLATEPSLELVGEATGGYEALQLASQTRPDILVLDLSMPDLDGIAVTKQLRPQQPNLRILILTIHEDEEYFFKMLQAGASGYVPKRAAPEELLTALRAAAAGEVYLYPSLAKLLVTDYLAEGPAARPGEAMDPLTEREQEVLAHLADGASNAEIAETLSISPKTVGRHRENIMRKLNLHSRTELVKYAIRKGIIQA